MCPSTRPSPDEGYRRPDSIFSVVVLPAPFGPRNPTTSPAPISNEIASTAVTSRVFRLNRLRTAARSPASRSGTLKIFVSSDTRMTAGSDTAVNLYAMKILLISQMYPGPADPDLGVFVRGLEEQLVARGHDVERAVLDRRAGGKRRYLTLARESVAVARRFKPDVAYAHFLVPTGLIAALGGRAPLVVAAHGQDVANVGSIPGIRAATRLVARRAAAIVAVSEYLRGQLEAKVPEARGKTEVID